MNENVKWGPAPEDGVETNIPGIYLSREAFGDEKPVDVLALAREAMAEFVAEYGGEPGLEVWLLTGEMRYLGGNLYLGFRTVSSYSWAGWIGKYPGSEPGAKFTSVESLSEVEEMLK